MPVFLKTVVDGIKTGGRCPQVKFRNPRQYGAPDEARANKESLALGKVEVEPGPNSRPLSKHRLSSNQKSLLNWIVGDDDMLCLLSALP